MAWDKEGGSPILNLRSLQMTYPRLIISLHFFSKQYIPPGLSKLVSSQLSLSEPSKDSSYQDPPILGFTRYVSITNDMINKWMHSNTHFTKGNKTFLFPALQHVRIPFRTWKIILFWLFVIFLLEDVSNKVKYVLEAYVCYLHFLFSHKLPW